MLDAAAIPVPKDMQGESILPLLVAEKGKGRDALYYHYYENGEHSVSPHFGIKTQRYKLIRFYKRVVSWELYDLQNDPHEMENLYGKKKFAKVTADLKRQLNDLIGKYEDDDAVNILQTDLSAR
jgi:arylsulfatase A-like enzyme